MYETLLKSNISIVILSLKLLQFRPEVILDLRNMEIQRYEKQKTYNLIIKP